MGILVISERRRKRLKEQIKKHNTKKKNFKSSKGKSTFTPDEALVSDYKRLSKYVSIKFDKDEKVLTDSDLRDYVKKSFRKDPGLRFLESSVSRDSSYNNIIDHIRSSSDYVNYVKSIETEIKVKGKVRRGIFFSGRKRYYIKVISPKSKTGKKLRPYLRYYQVKTGEQVKSSKVLKLDISAKKGNKEYKSNQKVEQMKSIRKRDSKLKNVRDKEKKQARIRRLRGRKV